MVGFVTADQSAFGRERSIKTGGYRPGADGHDWQSQSGAEFRQQQCRGLLPVI